MASDKTKNDFDASSDQMEEHSKIGWRIHIMNSDGNCFYHAISAAISGHFGEYSHLTPSQQNLRQLQMRVSIQEHLLNNLEQFYDYLPYTEHNVDMCSDEVYHQRLQQVEAITEEGVWGGQLEIAATASLFNTTVTVWSSGMTPQVHRPRYVDPLVAPIHLMYDSSHYNLLELFPVSTSNLPLSRTPTRPVSCEEPCKIEVLPIDVEELCKRTAKLILKSDVHEHDHLKPTLHMNRSASSTFKLGCVADELCNQRKTAKKEKKGEPGSFSRKGMIRCGRNVSLDQSQMASGEPIPDNCKSRVHHPVYQPFDCLAEVLLGDNSMHQQLQKMIFIYMELNRNDYSGSVLHFLRKSGRQIPHDDLSENIAVNNFFHELEFDDELRKIAVILITSLAFKINITVINADGTSEFFDGGFGDIKDGVVLMKDTNGLYTAIV